MKRVDRLFAILLVLQDQRKVRAKDLAQKFEVSERTIYRDMMALSEGGVPIAAIPNVGYELMEGFSMPPLLFTEDEAKALFLAGNMFVASAAGHVSDAAHTALAKVRVGLPRAMQTSLEHFASMLQISRPMHRFDLDEPRLSTLMRAIREHRVIWIRYHAANTKTVSEREVEPFKLSWYAGAWYVGGFCRMRREHREFRLSRVDALRLLDERFTPRHVPPPALPRIQVQVGFNLAAARWVRERQHYGYIGEQSNDERITMFYEVDSLDEIKSWILMWGAAVESLTPPELRDQVCHEAETLFARFRS